MRRLLLLLLRLLLLLLLLLLVWQRRGGRRLVWQSAVDVDDRDSYRAGCALSAARRASTSP